MVLAVFLKQCKAGERIPNSTETFMILKLYTQIVEGVLHKKRSSDIQEIDKYNLGHRYDAFFVPFLQFRYLKCIDDCIWDEMAIVCKSLRAVEIAKRNGFLKASIQLYQGDVLASKDIQISKFMFIIFLTKSAKKLVSILQENYSGTCLQQLRTWPHCICHVHGYTLFETGNY
jgi:hypothetical protein